MNTIFNLIFLFPLSDVYKSDIIRLLKLKTHDSKNSRISFISHYKSVDISDRQRSWIIPLISSFFESYLYQLFLEITRPVENFRLFTFKNERLICIYLSKLDVPSTIVAYWKCICDFDYFSEIFDTVLTKWLQIAIAHIVPYTCLLLQSESLFSQLTL